MRFVSPAYSEIYKQNPDTHIHIKIQRVQYAWLTLRSHKSLYPIDFNLLSATSSWEHRNRTTNTLCSLGCCLVLCVPIVCQFNWINENVSCIYKHISFFLFVVVDIEKHSGSTLMLVFFLCCFQNIVCAWVFAEFAFIVITVATEISHSANLPLERKSCRNTITTWKHLPGYIEIHTCVHSIHIISVACVAQFAEVDSIFGVKRKNNQWRWCVKRLFSSLNTRQHICIVQIFHLLWFLYLMIESIAH